MVLIVKYEGIVNMKRFKHIVIAAIAVVTAATYVLPAVPVAAETSATSSSLSIVPKKNYVIDPGKSVDDKLTIRNLDTGSSLSLTLRVIDFTYSDDSGTPKLFLDPNAEQTAWSLKKYLSVPETVTIPPKSSKTLDMKVSIPQGQGGGSLYSAIIYSSSSGGVENVNNVGLSASGVTLVFANVTGPVKESMSIEKFGSYNVANKSYFNFSTQEPQSMAFTVKNNGNVAEAPAGMITLKSMWGQEYKIEDLNPQDPKLLALIGQSRTFTSCIKSSTIMGDGGAADKRKATTTCESPQLWPGFYRASVEIYYGQNGNITQEASRAGWFVYLPWWFIAITIAVLVAAIYYGRKAYLKIRTTLYGPQGKSSKRSRRRS